MCISFVVVVGGVLGGGRALLVLRRWGFGGLVVGPRGARLEGGVGADGLYGSLRAFAKA